MNIYRHKFTAECPNNSRVVEYYFEVASERMIMAEDIVAACKVDKVFQEPLADTLYDRFGGRQVMRAFHHGVWVETHRG